VINDCNSNNKEVRMTPQKQTAPGTPKSPTSTETQRKPWKKKTPVDVVLDQINRLREDAAKKEEELKLARRQLQKLEEVQKVLQTA
jgi:hypothetical protein